MVGSVTNITIEQKIQAIIKCKLGEDKKNQLFQTLKKETTDVPRI